MFTLSRIFPSWLQRLFNVTYVFPTTQERKSAEQQRIEESAGMVSKLIDNAANLEDCYVCLDAIRDFSQIWGNNVQVNAWCDSLQLSLWAKERDYMRNRYGVNTQSWRTK